MANIIAQSKIIIELEADEVSAFATLISDVKNSYDPPQAVGFQMKPKFTVPDEVGELSVRLYTLLFGEPSMDNEENIVEDYN